MFKDILSDEALTSVRRAGTFFVVSRCNVSA